MTSAKSGSAGFTFLLLAIGVGAISMLQSLLSPVLPTLQAALDTTQGAVAWVIIAFLLSSAVATPILGRIGDTTGKVRTLMVALGAIAVGSVLSAFAPNIETLVVSRAIQGLGAAAFPLSYGILRDRLPAERVTAAVSSLASIIAVGGGVGVVLAGPVVDVLGWRALFWIPAALLALVMLLVWRFLPETDSRSQGRINWLAGALLAGWLVALLLPLSQGTAWGWTSPGVLVSFALALVLLVAWYQVETRSAQPLIDMRMMTLPAVWRTNLVALLFGGAMFAVWAFLPQFAQIPPSAGYGFGASVTQAGWLILPMLVTMGGAGMVSGRIAGRVSFRRQMAIGSGIASIAILGLALWHASLWQTMVSSGLFGLGLGLVYSTMINVIVQAVPPSQTGVASGMNANIRTIGGAIGTAVMTAIVTSGRQPSGFPLERGYTNGFVLFAIVAAVAMAVSLMMPRSQPRQSEQPAEEALSPAPAE
jgi:predicted MFS family arabinose efflux permease